MLGRAGGRLAYTLGHAFAFLRFTPIPIVALVCVQPTASNRTVTVDSRRGLGASIDHATIRLCGDIHS
jgi:hypothetical protein